MNEHPLKEFDTGAHVVVHGTLPAGENSDRVSFSVDIGKVTKVSQRLIISLKADIILIKLEYFAKSRTFQVTFQFSSMQYPLQFLQKSIPMLSDEHFPLKTLNMRAKNVIDQSYSAVKIKSPNGEMHEFHSNKGTLDRVRYPVHNPTVRAGMWHHFGENKEIHAA